MEKHELLEQVTKLTAQQKITLRELVKAYDEGRSSLESDIAKGNFIALVLYYLGGAIIFVGIAVLISQHWDRISFLTRLFVSFGIGIIAYTIGVLLEMNRKYIAIAPAFFFIALLVLPLGFYVYFDHLRLKY